MAQTVILGAGLAGLSTAYHLGEDYELLERDAEAGGLCRSYTIDGFTFDYTGHLLHMRDDYTKALVAKLLPDTFVTHARDSAIYSKGVYTDYPFQANTYGLPPEVIKDCIAGFVEAQAAAGEFELSEDLSFEAWVLGTFGTGIAEHFMLPYNTKLWRTPLSEVSADWVAWSVPRPTLDEVLNGALGIRNRAFGYNPSFLYPKTGGISQLPGGLAAHVSNLRLETEVVEVSLSNRTVHCADGTSYPFENLVSTLPLPELVRMLTDAPARIREAAARLRHVSVYCVNLGVDRPDVSKRHWVYFPEPEFPFYRAGFPGNFAPATMPAGCSSMYVEVSHRPETVIPEESLVDGVLDALLGCGILKNRNEVIARKVVDLSYAYVIYDHARQRALEEIGTYLDAAGILSTGRYGNWEYASMEKAILDGRDAACKILSMVEA
jgi:protoporphyrinogen oxidase